MRKVDLIKMYEERIATLQEQLWQLEKSHSTLMEKLESLAREDRADRRGAEQQVRVLNSQIHDLLTATPETTRSTTELSLPLEMGETPGIGT